MHGIYRAMIYVDLSYIVTIYRHVLLAWVLLWPAPGHGLASADHRGQAKASADHRGQAKASADHRGQS
jgi:hypothetical protein